MIETEVLSIVLLPLLGSLLAGLFSLKTDKLRLATSLVTIVAVLGSCLLSYDVLFTLLQEDIQLYKNLYIFSVGGYANFFVGLLVDNLTAIMLVVVTSISLLVHIYSIAYMQEDKGYQKFFSYISFFTFAMLVLVLANNFLQLFFGWEAVGLASYLLIGFWYQKDSASKASMKAFLVNRLGDLGFLLGIACIYTYFGTLDYQQVFTKAQALFTSENVPVLYLLGLRVDILTFICICLFVGAMGKSAQVPLHVWLPDSMEGPTPISALIHAATMVTAGVFMLARMSYLFELSEIALNFVLFTGAITCLFMGILGVVQNDIKRIIAYSTLSQLGYMVVACGVSAYAAGIFHLVTHAFFKALLFLGAGSVIVALHHKQDIWQMGGLSKKMPVTHVTMLLATLSLVGFPFFSGFYSKDLIIQVVPLSKLAASGFATFAVNASVLFTSLYSFRLLFVVFYAQPKLAKEVYVKVKEPSFYITTTLLVLMVPSVLLGFYVLQPICGSLLENAIFVSKQHNAFSIFNSEIKDPISMGVHGFTVTPFWLICLGFVIAWLCYLKFPHIPAKLQRRFTLIYQVLSTNYGFDKFNEKVIVPVIKGIGCVFAYVLDKKIIDGLLVNGLAVLVAKCARVFSASQTGYIYHYVFAMLLGLLSLIFMYNTL